MEPAIIREMTSADVDSVTKIYAEVFDASYISFGELDAGQAEAPGKPSEKAPKLFRQELNDIVGTPQAGLFVASLGAEIVGFAVATLNQTKIGHTECWLQDLGTLPNYRRQGVAKDLIAQVLNWGTQKGAKYFLLESGIKNDAAHKLFEQQGFHPLATVFWHKGLLPDA